MRRAHTLAGVAGACVLLLALALLSWLAIQQHTASVEPPRPPVREPLRAPTLPLPLPAIAEAAARAAPAPKALQPDDVEFCGLGIAKAGSEAASALEAQANGTSERAMWAHLQRMRQSPDARTRAAAMMVTRDHTPLVEMALRTADPTVYTFALQACAARGPETAEAPPCLMISAAQAARLDPDNAAVWFDVATHARERKDNQAVAAALHRATMAAQLRPRSFEFASLALAAVPPQMPQADRAAVLVAMIGIQAALPMSSYFVVSTYCDAAALADANRRQTCDALATLLVGQGRSLIDLSIGRRIGERVGWSLERNELIAAQLDFSMTAMVDAFAAAPGGSQSCEALRRSEHWWQSVVTLGERAAVQALLARANVTTEQMLEQYRRRQQQRAEETAAAASAASAPR